MWYRESFGVRWLKFQIHQGDVGYPQGLNLQGRHGLLCCRLLCETPERHLG